MIEKKKYKVAVTEMLRRVVIVEAADEEEAHQRALDAWHNGEITLVAEDFDGAEFYVLSEADGSESEKYLDRIDTKGGREEVDTDG